jgi:hypothetical protein
MDVTTKHPQITLEREFEWRLMRDTYAGEQDVKYSNRQFRQGAGGGGVSRGQVYLPVPSGFKSLGESMAAAMYEAYKLRANFPEIVAPSIGAMIGIVHAKEAQIAMPEGMMYLWENADGDNTALEAFHARITRNLLKMGRFGILADAPKEGGLPYLYGYSAESVINWDKDFYVLDETSIQRNGFAWETTPRYRVLELIDGRYVSTIFEGENLAPEFFEPRGLGGAALTRIPFAVGTARDVTADVETPPLVGVANAAIAMYQLSADYRHQLYMSGQETLVALNGPAPRAVGAGVVHEMRGDGDNPADLKYVSPSCSGIEAHRLAIQEQKEQAVMAGARMFDNARSQESGDARRLRFASEMANLTSVAMVSAGLLEQGLRGIADLLGLNREEVVVTPPADLLDTTMTPEDASKLMLLWQNGAISYQTFYDNLQKGGIASTERTSEDEARLVDERPDTLGADMM